MKSKLIMLVGFVFTMLTVAEVNLASWTLVCSEPVPDELK
ncbi:hypothetical protein J2W97_001249 [Paenibacillus jamilae]|nr:hypothetical protein [Paenibacillus jamilae]